MKHAAVFDHFSPKQVVASGYSIYDFLGVTTDSRFKKGWSKFAPPRGSKYTPPLPSLNEHYFDWILTLESVARAAGAYRMIELGAGWGTWSVIGATAARQSARIDAIEIVAIEADHTHYDWMRRHFASNDLTGETMHLIHGAVAPKAGTVRFPILEDPSEDYGASMKQVHSGRPFIDVPAYTLASLMDRMSGTVDFVHVDIQGAEYDIIPPIMDLLRKRVKSMMIGTHTSLEKHHEMSELFRRNGWRETMNYPRGELCVTPYGNVQFGDGLVAVENPDFI
ncbi:MULTISPECIES: FkbM family methyltransferase [Hyphobacterium]|uniref:FkbM family methyltransferase n=1 Tax=Hyphobacterium vulgare TaxID=1736751 RepID=A0ABV6ZYY1_9PROT